MSPAARAVPVLGLLLALSAPAVSRAEMALLVNRDGPLSSLTHDQAMRVYLGDIRRLHGTDVVPVTYTSPPGAEARFLREVLGISPDAYRAHWIREVFRGDGRPPRKAADAAAAARMVADQPGAVGFVCIGDLPPEGLPPGVLLLAP